MAGTGTWRNGSVSEQDPNTKEFCESLRDPAKHFPGNGFRGDPGCGVI